MSKVKKDTIEAKGFAIQVYTEDFKNDYISLTDIARYKNAEEPNVVVANWMRNYNTIEYLGIWEQLNNLEFKPLEFEGFLEQAGSNVFTLSPQKWVNMTNAKGIYVKFGRGGGTFAHKDIAFKFASWISAEFELYIIKDYQRLKDDENSRLSLGWNLNREISKINYKIHTDAIKEYLLKDLTNEQLSYKYASEADMLNVALFNKRAKQWREENPDLKGNMRDYASLNELLVLANSPDSIRSIRRQYAAFAKAPLLKDVPIEYFRNTGIITSVEEIAELATRERLARVLNKLEISVALASEDDYERLEN